MDGDPIDQLAEQLRTDPVVIEVAMGSGRADEYDDRLTTLVRELPFKAYVALVEQPAGLSADASDQLPALLHRRLQEPVHRRLQEPGLYVTDTTEGILQVETFGIDLDPSVLFLATYDTKELIEVRMVDEFGQE